jgi:hypothetical protein
MCLECYKHNNFLLYMYRLTVTHRLKRHNDISPIEKAKIDKKRHPENQFDQTYSLFHFF